MCVIYILHSREPSLRLTISQAGFFFFSSVLFSPSTFWHGAQRIQMSTLFIIIQYDFSDLLSILCGVFTKEKKTGLTSCWLRANTWKSSIKRQKKRCQDDSISQFILLKLIELKSVNLQYNTLVCWANGTNDSSTKPLISYFLIDLGHSKNSLFSFL